VKDAILLMLVTLEPWHRRLITWCTN